MSKVAILCNMPSSVSSARSELIAAIRAAGHQAYWGCIYDGKIHESYSEQTAVCLPIVASRNNTNPLGELRSMNSVRKAVKKNGIEYVIVYGVKNHAAMALGARQGGARRVLCVVNGSGNLFRVGGWKGRLLRAIAFPMLRLAYKRSCAICFQNEDDRQLFLQKKLVKDTDRCFVTGGSGVNLEIFRKQVLPEENRFLFLSRITPTKGVVEYIQAAEIVRRKYPDAVFDIVGPLDAAVESAVGRHLQDIIEQAVADGIVRYHGATDDVPSWMGKCRFFVYPSYYPEGVPRCAIQAIASGRPIITCQTPGCKETVRDGENGFAVLPRDVAALAEKMLWMIENPEKAREMANASRALAEERFDVNKINQALLDRVGG